MIDISIIWKKAHGLETSEKEESELSLWLNSNVENKAYFEKALHHFKSEKSNDASTHVGDWTEIAGDIKPKRSGQVKYWIAAAILLPVFLAVTFFVLQMPQPEQVNLAASQKIEPGSDKAVLITSNGDQISLDESDNLSIRDKSSSISTKEGVLYYEETTGEDSRVNQLLVPRGGKYSVRLSDGTKVWLNSESELKYPVQFNENTRVVQLKGEGYFEVARDLNRPFVLKTSTQEVEVLGTAFNVSAYEDEKLDVVTLVEGKVKISTSRIGVEKIMLPEDQFVFYKPTNDWSLQKVDPPHVQVWINFL